MIRSPLITLHAAASDSPGLYHVNMRSILRGWARGWARDELGPGSRFGAGSGVRSWEGLGVG